MQTAILVGTHISHAEILGLITDDRDKKFHKHHVDVRYINKIIKQPADQWENHMGRD